ncbi:MAG TPA: phage holin family protein [Bdellovibrionales bacterium]|nr:MAG: hypothetical protein A2X97_02880 [Bdellovibrionales bacterium GWA1_52_35]OFZ39969.1 MAG: hypothetical protein A2070_07965 [Bdellovibrionales bacterium GWC1_52_8]HAR42857.1 phage holin family protein [Bdellovibrionales bacterium]HCM40137.1 phage holin family protein [Bdellovibrionales bacterium]
MDENKIQYLRPEAGSEEYGQELHEEEHRSTRELTGQLSRDAISLVSREIELAKTEMREKVDQAEDGLKSMAMGAAIFIPGGLVAVAALVLLLSTFMQAWIAAALVAIAIFVTGYILISAGRKKFKTENLRPEATISSLRDDGRVAKEVWNARRKNG